MLTLLLTLAATCVPADDVEPDSGTLVDGLFVCTRGAFKAADCRTILIHFDGRSVTPYLLEETEECRNFHTLYRKQLHEWGVEGSATIREKTRPARAGSNMEAGTAQAAALKAESCSDSETTILFGLAQSAGDTGPNGNEGRIVLDCGTGGGGRYALTPGVLTRRMQALLASRARPAVVICQIRRAPSGAEPGQAAPNSFCFLDLPGQRTAATPATRSVVSPVEPPAAAPERTAATPATPPVEPPVEPPAAAPEPPAAAPGATAAEPKKVSISGIIRCTRSETGKCQGRLTVDVGTPQSYLLTKNAYSMRMHTRYCTRQRRCTVEGILLSSPAGDQPGTIDPVRITFGP